MAEVAYGSLPFKEQIAFFRDKVNLPTRAWTDIWEGMHARAFVVAGASKSELLEDLRTAVDKAISQGTTIETFRKDFDTLVAKHGWSYNGGRGWRTRVIYETNLRTSYQAGRYAQMTDPDFLASYPYWRYVHSDFVAHPRPEHVAWDNLVLRYDDPWWSTHHPPNGWGCRCRIVPESAKSLARKGLSVNPAPPTRYVTKRVGANGPSPRTVRMPEGIDPGWAYNVGEAAWGRPLSQTAMAQWRAAGAQVWERLPLSTWQAIGRPAAVPDDPPRAQLAPRAESQTVMAATLRTILGGEEKVFNVGGLPVLVNAKSLAEHVELERSEFLPFITETLEDPFETWLAFERHQGSGLIRLRARLVKRIDVGRGRIILFVAHATRGMLEGWTMLPTSNANYVNGQRSGILLQGRD